MNLNKGCIEILRWFNNILQFFKMNLNKGCIEIVQLILRIVRICLDEP